MFLSLIVTFRFFLRFCFQQFYYDMLRCVLSILNYAWIFLSFLDLYIGTSHQIEEHFSHYSFKNVLTLFSFPPPLQLPATSENPVIPVLDHAITPTDDWGSIYGFSIFFSLVLQFRYVLLTLFKFTDPFFCRIQLTILLMQ